MKKIIRNETGFSVIQGIIMAGAVATMGLIGARLSMDQKMAARTVDSRGKIDQLHELISTVLQNKDHCTQTFSALGNTIDPAAVSLKDSMIANNEEKFRRVVTANSITAFQINDSAVYDASKMYMDNTISIEEMKLNYPADLKDPATITVNYKRFDQNANRRSGNGYGGQSISKTIPITIVRNGANFQSCYASSLTNSNVVKEFCEDLGNYFTWDAVNNVCQAKDQTCAGKAFVGFDATGNRICKNFEEWLDLNQVVDTTSTGAFACANSTGVRFDTTTKPGKAFATCFDSKCLDIGNVQYPSNCTGGYKTVTYDVSGGSGDYEYTLLGTTNYQTTWAPVGPITLPGSGDILTLTVRDKNEINRKSSMRLRPGGCGEYTIATPPACNQKCLDINLDFSDTSCTMSVDGYQVKRISYTVTGNTGYIFAEKDAIGATFRAHWTGADGPPQTHGELYVRESRSMTIDFYDNMDTQKRVRVKVDSQSCGQPLSAQIEPCGTKKPVTCLTVTNSEVVPGCIQLDPVTSVRKVAFEVTGGSGQYECFYNPGGNDYYVDCEVYMSKLAKTVWTGYSQNILYIRDKLDHYKMASVIVKLDGCGGPGDKAEVEACY